MDKKWWALIAVCLGTFMLLLDVTIVTVAQPAIQSGLHAGFSDVQWILDAYALTLASLLLTSGVLADRYGRRLLFALGLAIFTIGSLLCGLAVNPLMLIVSRCGQGVGGAIMFATSLALLGNSFRGRDRGIAFGAWGAVTGVATALGPVLGGVLTSDWDWRGIFLVNVPVGVFALVVTLWQVPESRVAHPSRPDWAGFALLTCGLVALVYGLIRAGEISWSDHGVYACLAAAVVLLAAFIVVEARGAHPLFDLSLLRVPTFAGGSIAAFCMNGSLFAMMLYLVLYLQDSLGYSAQDAGLRLAIISFAQLITATLAGRASARVPVRWLIGPGLLLVGIGLVLMAGLTGTSSWTHLLPGFIVSGLGTGLVNPPLASTAIGVVPPHQAGMASGVNATFRQVGIATGIAALGSIFTSGMRTHLASVLPPSLAGSAGEIVNHVRQGSAGQLLSALPAPDRAAAGLALRSSFAAGLNDVMYVTAGLAAVGAVCATLLIRGKDFHRPGGAEPGAGGPGTVEHGVPVSPSAVPVSLGGVLLPPDGVPVTPGGVLVPPDGVRAAPAALANEAGPDGLMASGYVRDGDGSPLPGATVTLIDLAGQRAGIGRSDPDGRYLVPAPARGTYTLIAMAGSHEPSAAAVRVADRPAKVDVLLTREPPAPPPPTGARVAGTAWNRSGTAVPDARVTLLDTEGNVAAVATTGPDGTYSFENLPEGEYTVIAAGYPSVTSWLKVAGTDPHSHDVELGHPEA